MGITIHEYCHALVADRLGDPTPRSQGRLSLNPLAHLDPLGTVMLFVAHFGWGKPVVIDSYNFSHPRRDELLVSLAGPASNFALALLFSLIIRFTHLNYPLFIILIYVNLSLAVFNLLPLPPLDGSKIFLNLLPVDTGLRWQEAFDKYGIYLLALTLFLPFGGSNIISLITAPAINILASLLLNYN